MGASAERGAGEGGFDPQPKGRPAWGKYKRAREALARHTTHDTAAPPSRGVAWGGVLRTKDPTDDPAELHHVLSVGDYW
jgi:hypothetical protein